MADATLNFMDPASKGRLLEVVRREIDDMFALADDPATWEAPTACAEWQVRDVFGHLVDTTEGYLPAFDIARSGGTAPEPHGLRLMEMGLVPGAPVRVVKTAPLGDPIQVCVHNYHLALRRTEARSIKVIIED